MSVAFAKLRFGRPELCPGVLATWLLYAFANEAFSSSQQSLCQSQISLHMAIKPTDVQKGASEDDSLPGASRFAIMGGMFRSSKDEEEVDNDEEERGWFLKERVQTTILST